MVKVILLPRWLLSLVMMLLQLLMLVLMLLMLLVMLLLMALMLLPWSKKTFLLHALTPSAACFSSSSSSSIQEAVDPCLTLGPMTLSPWVSPWVRLDHCNVPDNTARDSQLSKQPVYESL